MSCGSSGGTLLASKPQLGCGTGNALLWAWKPGKGWGTNELALGLLPRSPVPICCKLAKVSPPKPWVHMSCGSSGGTLLASKPQLGCGTGNPLLWSWKPGKGWGKNELEFGLLPRSPVPICCKLAKVSPPKPWVDMSCGSSGGTLLASKPQLGCGTGNPLLWRKPGKGWGKNELEFGLLPRSPVPICCKLAKVSPPKPWVDMLCGTFGGTLLASKLWLGFGTGNALLWGWKSGKDWGKKELACGLLPSSPESMCCKSTTCWPCANMSWQNRLCWHALTAPPSGINASNPLLAWQLPGMLCNIGNGISNWLWPPIGSANTTPWWVLWPMAGGHALGPCNGSRPTCCTICWGNGSCTTAFAGQAWESKAWLASRLWNSIICCPVTHVLSKSAPSELVPWPWASWDSAEHNWCPAGWREMPPATRPDSHALAAPASGTNVLCNIGNGTCKWLWPPIGSANTTPWRVLWPMAGGYALGSGTASRSTCCIICCGNGSCTTAFAGQAWESKAWLASRLWNCIICCPVTHVLSNSAPSELVPSEVSMAMVVGPRPIWNYDPKECEVTLPLGAALSTHLA